MPGEFQVCPSCQGHKTEVNPSIDAGGISGEVFAQDPGFARDYFNGVYDRPCSECKGEGLVFALVDDPDRLTEEQREFLAQVRDYERDSWDFAREVAAERAFGC